MVKFSTTFFVTLVIVAPALAIPTNIYKKRDAREQNIYQRTSESELETLVSREPFLGLLMNIAKIGIKVGTKAAKGAKKIHSAHNKYNNRHRHKRDLDEESLAARELEDELEAREFDAEFDLRSNIEELD